MQLQISSRRENRQGDTWVIEIRAPGKFLANTFALSGSEDISGLLNRGGMANLPLFKTILAICQKSQELEFLEKFLANIFTLSDAEDNTSGLLNRGMEDLPLLKTLLAICKKS